MDCKELMERHRIENADEQRHVKEVAKTVLSYLSKKDIPLTPANYDEWFYVVCHAMREHHLLSEKNLSILYKKYRADLIKVIDGEKKEIKQISNNLRSVTQESNEILERFESNIGSHSELIDESIEAIDNHDAEKMEELRSKIESLEVENERLRRYIEKNRKRLEIVEAKFAETKKEADIDSLTKIFNRKRFDKDMEEFDLNCNTYSIIFLDVDDFKKINDTYGHAVGDKVLMEIGEILTHYLRRNTYAYRYGGEEFVVVLPEGDLNGAKVVAERLREVMENRAVKIDERSMITFTASFGASQKRQNEHFNEVLKRADEALYEAKRSGKNKIVVK